MYHNFIQNFGYFVDDDGLPVKLLSSARNDDLISVSYKRVSVLLFLLRMLQMLLVDIVIELSIFSLNCQLF